MDYSLIGSFVHGILQQTSRQGSNTDLLHSRQIFTIWATISCHIPDIGGKHFSFSLLRMMLSSLPFRYNVKLFTWDLCFLLNVLLWTSLLELLLFSLHHNFCMLQFLLYVCFKTVFISLCISFLPYWFFRRVLFNFSHICESSSLLCMLGKNVYSGLLSGWFL